MNAQHNIPAIEKMDRNWDTDAVGGWTKTDINLWDLSDFISTLIQFSLLAR